MSNFTENKPKTGIKPVYLILANDSTTKAKFTYYLAGSTGLVEGNAILEFRGKLLAGKTQAEELKNKPCAIEDAPGISVNRKIPWHKIERLENITYNSK